MKKIAFASVATLGLLGTAVVPAFGATGLTQSQQQAAQLSVGAGVHCKVKHWAHRRGFRDAIRGDAFAARRDDVDAAARRDRFRKDVDFDRNDVENRHRHRHHFGHNDEEADGAEKENLADENDENDEAEDNDQDNKRRHHHRHDHRRKHRFDDVDVRARRHDLFGHRRDAVLLKRDAARVAHRWDERRLWGTEKWCRGRPVMGVAAGGGWHAKSRRK